MKKMAMSVHAGIVPTWCHVVDMHAHSPNGRQSSHAERKRAVSRV
jgi:hypothetical protein